MNQVEFNYKGKKIFIQCKENDIMNGIIKRFINKALIDEDKINTLIILYGGNIINDDKQQLSFNQIANKQDITRKIMSFVVEETPEIKKNNVLISSKDIICPKCKELILIKILNYKIKLFNCKNEHIIDNLSLKDFEKSQYINYSKIICENCKEKNMDELNMNKFYKCYECNIYLCNKCKDIHNINHNTTNYTEINYVCGKHNNDIFVKYCNTCKINICMPCEVEHNEHNLIYFGSILSDKKKLNNKLDNVKDSIDKCNKDFMEIIKKLNEAQNYITLFIELCQLLAIISHNFQKIFFGA